MIRRRAIHEPSRCRILPIIARTRAGSTDRPVDGATRSRRSVLGVVLIRRMPGRQRVLRDALGRRARQRVEALPVARHLERREPLGRPGPQFAELDRSGASTTKALISSSDRSDGTPDHRTFDDGGMRRDRLLDLERRQVLTAPAQHFLLARDEREDAGVVDGDQIAGAQPAVGVDRRRRLGRASPSSRASPRDCAAATRPRRRRRRPRSTTRASFTTPSVGCCRTVPSVPNGREPRGQISPYGLSDIA